MTQCGFESNLVVSTYKIILNNQILNLMEHAFHRPWHSFVSCAIKARDALLTVASVVCTSKWSGYVRTYVLYCNSKELTLSHLFVPPKRFLGSPPHPVQSQATYIASSRGPSVCPPSEQYAFEGCLRPMLWRSALSGVWSICPPDEQR